MVNDKKIKELNFLYRGINMSTDVLSFPMKKGRFRYLHPEVLGDIVVSMPAVLRQARERDITLNEELNKLLIHSILHLEGYTHETTSSARRMKSKEKEIAALISES